MVRFIAGRCLLIGLAVLVCGDVRAQTPDPHLIYERKCASCHVDHAGDFAEQSLDRSQGRLIGRKTHKDVRVFLEAGHGRLSANEIEPIVMHLTAILQSGRLFRDKCRMCHDRAVVLARRELMMRADGTLVGRYSGRDMQRFLQNHGRLDTDEVSKMLAVLSRHLAGRQD